MPTPSGFPTSQDLINAQKDVEHLGRVVNSEDAQGNPIASSTNRTGGTNKTLDALQAEYQSAIQATGGVPLGTWAAGVTYNAYNEYLAYNGIPFKPAEGTPLPYTTQGSDPTVAPDAGLVVPFSPSDHHMLFNREDPNAHPAEAIDMGAGNSLADISRDDSSVVVGGVEAGDITKRLQSVESDLEDLPEQLSGFITSEANRAEAAADAAFTNADIYPDVAAGLSSTSDGQQFQVLDGEWYVRYQNDAGSAVEVGRISSLPGIPYEVSNSATPSSVQRGSVFNGFIEVGSQDVTIKALNSAFSYKMPIEPYQRIYLRARGNDRFRVAVTDTIVETYPHTVSGAGKLIVSDDNLTEFDFTNDAEGAEVYLYYSTNDPDAEGKAWPFLEFVPPILSRGLSDSLPVNQLSRPPLSLVDGSPVSEEGAIGEPVNLALNSFDVTTGLQVDYNIEQRSIQFKLKPNQTVRATAKNNNRFRVGVFNSDNIVEGDFADRVIVDDDERSEVLFRNDAEGKICILYFANTISTAEPPYDPSAAGFIEEMREFGFPLLSESAKNGVDHEFSVSFSGVDNKKIGTASRFRADYPSLVSIKMPNHRLDHLPNPIGWLYVTNEEPYEFLYASNTSHNPTFLAAWDKSLTYDGNAGPDSYNHYITSEGDIICVLRGDIISSVGRANPIVYPSSDYANPVVVDLASSGTTPTAWLQNCGAECIYSDGTFLFGEYTRPHHTESNVWRVTKPYQDPANWQVVKTEPKSSIEHFHTLQFDTYARLLYLSSGDSDNESKVWMSPDGGATWSLQGGGFEKYYRALNWVFLEDAAYWCSDSGFGAKHFVLKAPRDVNGVVDFSLNNIVELHKYPYTPALQATYATCYIREPNGLLFLDRYDATATDTAMTMYFYSFDYEDLIEVGQIKPLPGEGNVGFRSVAISWYQPENSKDIMVGWSNLIRNRINVLGNEMDDLVNNMSLELSVINKRSTIY